MDPQRLRRELQETTNDDLWRRRAIIGVSLLGMASMSAVSLLQTGMIRHLPDPPLRGFNSDKVNSSSTAYQLGVPDGTLAVFGCACNLPIAAFGGADRAREQPWVPLFAAAKGAFDAAIAAWYFLQMPTKEQAWCGYCIIAALVDFTVFGLTLPEARKAWATWREA